MERMRFIVAMTVLGVLVLTFLTTLVIAAASEGFWPTLGWSSVCYGSMLCIKVFWRHWGA